MLELNVSDYSAQFGKTYLFAQRLSGSSTAINSNPQMQQFETFVDFIHRVKSRVQARLSLAEQLAQLEKSLCVRTVSSSG